MEQVSLDWESFKSKAEVGNANSFEELCNWDWTKILVKNPYLIEHYLKSVKKSKRDYTLLANLIIDNYEQNKLLYKDLYTKYSVWSHFIHGEWDYIKNRSPKISEDEDISCFIVFSWY